MVIAGSWVSSCNCETGLGLGKNIGNSFSYIVSKISKAIDDKYGGWFETDEETTSF